MLINSLLISNCFVFLVNFSLCLLINVASFNASWHKNWLDKIKYEKKKYFIKNGKFNGKWKFCSTLIAFFLLGDARWWCTYSIKFQSISYYYIKNFKHLLFSQQWFVIMVKINNMLCLLIHGLFLLPLHSRWCIK